MLRLLALAGAAMIMAGAPAALAQDATFFTVTYVEVGPVLGKVGASALKTLRDESRKENGVVAFEVFQRIDRPNQFAVLASWTNQMAYDAHAAGNTVKKLNEKLATMLVAPSDTRQHNALSVASQRTGKDPIVAITHVDVIPPQKDNAVVALKELAENSRKQSGNLAFDVWQQTNRPNHFTVVEAWNNRGAFDLHQMQKETREFRTKLTPMAGALYDERLYKAVRSPPPLLVVQVHLVRPWPRAGRRSPRRRCRCRQVRFLHHRFRWALKTCGRWAPRKRFPTIRKSRPSGRRA